MSSASMYQDFKKEQSVTKRFEWRFAQNEGKTGMSIDERIRELERLKKVSFSHFENM